MSTIRERVQNMSPEAHERLFTSFCSAWILNKRGGFHSSAALSRRQMDAVASFGKIPPERMADIEKNLRECLPMIEQLIQEISEQEIESLRVVSQ